MLKPRYWEKEWGFFFLEVQRAGELAANWAMKEVKPMASGKTRTIRVARDAETGEYVTMEYARRNPKTTVIETSKVPTPSPRKKSK